MTERLMIDLLRGRKHLHPNSLILDGTINTLDRNEPLQPNQKRFLQGFINDIRDELTQDIEIDYEYLEYLNQFARRHGIEII